MAIDWKKVKHDYLSENFNVNELAEKYKCHPDTIRRKARINRWRPRSEPPSKPGPIFTLADAGTPTAPADGHMELWKEVRKRLEKGLKSSDLKQGLDELKVAKAAVEVFSKIIEGEIQSCGLKDEGGEKTLDDTKKITEAMESLTVPQRAGEALDGE